MLPPPCAYTHNEVSVVAANSANAKTAISLSYMEQWKQRKQKSKNHHLIVFDAVWWRCDTTTTASDRLLLLACTNTGEIVVWKQQGSQEDVDDVYEEEKEANYTEHNPDSMNMNWSKTPTTITSDPQNRLMSTAPHVRIQVSTGVLYSMKMVSFPSQTKSVLILSGDEGILLFDWSTWFSTNSNIGNNNTVIDSDRTDCGRPSGTLSLPLHTTTTLTNNTKNFLIAKYQTYPSPHERTFRGGTASSSVSCGGVEINDFDLLLHSQYIMGASGDAFGAYKWNLETQQLVATYPTALQQQPQYQQHLVRNSNHCPYMHSIKTLHCNNHANDDKLVLMGGEGGVLSLWDGQQDACIEKWSLTTHQAQQPLHQPHYFFGALAANKQSTTASNMTTSGWISTIETLSDDTWWIVGGGINTVTVGASGGGGGRHLSSPGSSTPTSSCTSSGFWSTFHGPTRSRITMPLHNNNNNSKTHVVSETQQQRTRAPITKVMATKSNDSTTGWYSVGLEGVVRQWSLSSSMAVAAGRHSILGNNIQDDTISSPSRSKAFWCDSPCAYAIACSSSHQDNDDDDDALNHNMVAIGGVGSVVNIFKDYNGVLVADQSLTL